MTLDIEPILKSLSRTTRKGWTVAMTHWLAGIAAVAVGILAWELVIPAGTTKEAWDIPVYWQASFPAVTWS